MLFVPFPRLQLFLLSRKLRAGRAARVTIGASRRNSLYPCIAESTGQYNSARKNAHYLFVFLTRPAAGKILLVAEGPVFTFVALAAAGVFGYQRGSVFFIVLDYFAMSEVLG